MKTKFMFILISLLISTFSYAKVSIGVVGGGGMSWLHGDVGIGDYFYDGGDAYNVIFTDPTLSYEGGVLINAGTEGFIICLEAFYRRVGLDYKVNESFALDDTYLTGTATLDYLYFPVKIRFKNNAGYFLEFGGYYSQLNEIESSIDDLDDDESENFQIDDTLFEENDYGIVSGFGIDKGNMSLSARISYSLTDMLTEDYQEQNDYTTLVNAGIYLMVKL